MEQQIQITYSDKSLGAESFWAYMIQKEDKKEDPSAVTFAEAANIIDSMYNIKPCGTEEEQNSASGSTDAGGMEADWPTYEDYTTQLQNTFLEVYNPCEGLYGDNSYDATLLVYISDVTKPYKLNLGNGEVTSTVRHTSDVSIVLPINGDTVQVDLPIHSNLESDYTIHSHNSKTVLFRDNIIGAVHLSYKTTYDEVTLNVKAVDGEMGGCQCLLFYQSTVTEVNIVPPEVDEEAKALLDCHTPVDLSSSGSSGDGTTPEADVDFDCFIRVINEARCNCAPYDTAATSEEVYQVPCDTPWASGNVSGAYDTYFEAVVIKGYSSVYCINFEPWEGSTDEYYIEKCCVPPPDDISLPICKESKAIDYGGQDIIGGRAKYTPLELSNTSVSFVPVSPKDGICGEITYVQNVKSKNCCDDPFYEDMVVDEDESVEVLADYSSGVIFWTGGTGTVDIILSGSGFYLDDMFTQTSGTVYGNFVRIFTEDACGACVVRLDDGCTQDEHVIRSTDGTWRILRASRYPSCFDGCRGEDLGLTRCSSYAASYVTDHGCSLKGEYWVGNSGVPPGTASCNTHVSRISFVCGLFGKKGGPQVVWGSIQEAGMRTAVPYACHHSRGEGTCIPYPPGNWATIYFFPGKVTIAKWEC